MDRKHSRFIEFIKSFKGLTLKRKTLMASVYVLLGISRLAVKFIHFRHLAGFLGKAMVEAEYEENQGKKEQAYIIGRFIAFVSDFTPWVSDCFPQALTATLLLKVFRVPSTTYFGIHTDADGMKAHAWVRHGEMVVTGEEGLEMFSVVAYFGS